MSQSRNSNDDPVTTNESIREEQDSNKAVLDQLLASPRSSEIIKDQDMDRELNTGYGPDEVDSSLDKTDSDDYVELPTTPVFGYFVISNAIKCYIGPREGMTSWTHYPTARDNVQKVHTVCASTYPRDRRWFGPLREMEEALGLNHAEIMSNTDDLAEDPEHKPVFEQQAVGKQPRTKAMIEFNETYDKFFHDAEIEAPKKRTGRKSKRVNTTVSLHSDDLPGSSLIEDGAGVGLEIPVMKSTRHERKRLSLGGSETSLKKPRIRTPWKEVWPEAPATIPQTMKSAKQIARYIMQDRLPTKMEMFKWDMDVFTKYDAKLRNHHIKSVLSAKEADGSLIVSDEMCRKMVANYDNWIAVQENPGFRNRKGSVRKRPLSTLTDIRATHSGKFKLDPKARQFNPLSHHQALHKALTDDHGQVFAGPREKGTKFRPARIKANLLLARVNERELTAAETIEEARKMTVEYEALMEEQGDEIERLEQEKLALADTVRKSVESLKGWKEKCGKMEHIVDWHCAHEQARSHYVARTVPGFSWPKQLADAGDIGDDPSKLPIPTEDLKQLSIAIQENAWQSLTTSAVPDQQSNI